MSMKTTLISHMYNEEYLLPFWLNHHKDMFDHGIIIDYRSTDNSLSIIKEICPSWEIRTTRNSCFKASDIDSEVMDIENCVEGIKMVLNTTEFLFLSKPIRDFFPNNSIVSYGIVSYAPFSKNEYHPLNIQEIYMNLLNPDIKYHDDRGIRQIHNFKNGNYGLGRHNTLNKSMDTTDMHIIWLGFFPLNEQLLKRKLQIKDNMAESDKEVGLGFQHLWGKQTMLEINEEKVNSGKPLSDLNKNVYNILNNFKQKCLIHT